MDLQIRIKDSNFSHAISLGNGDLKVYSKYFEWYRGNEPREITIYTDNFLYQVNKYRNESKINIAWLLEPYVIKQDIYKYIFEQGRFVDFDYVFTHEKQYVNNKNILFVPYGGCWIYEKDWCIYPKTKNVSIISSNKRMTFGHSLRHGIIKKLANEFDLICGNGYSPIEYKLDALKDYRYSVVIENDKKETWFTEKLIDCFMTGTIPIYWGTSLKDYFDKNGIIEFSTLDEIENILSSINEEDYKKRLPAIKKNFKIAKQYTNTEDWIYTNILKKLIKE